MDVTQGRDHRGRTWRHSGGLGFLGRERTRSKSTSGREDLSLADRQHLVEFGGAEATIITGGKPGQVEKEVRIDASTFKRSESVLIFTDGPTNSYEMFETPHFVVATVGKIRPQAVARDGRTSVAWHGLPAHEFSPGLGQQARADSDGGGAAVPMRAWRPCRRWAIIPSSLDEADAVIVNTCAVTEKTERKIVRRLSLLQGERLIVAGCLPVAIPESVCRISCRERLGLLNRSSAARISEFYNDSHNYSDARSHDSPSQSQDFLMHSPALETGQDLCAVVNVAEGCNGSCSYCIVAKARGRLKSCTSEDVARKVEKLLARGTVEVQVSAQDTAAYGLDIGTNLGQLLERLAVIPGDFMLRVGMMNPNSALLIKDQLLRAFRSPKIYSFLHIPVQSGSDKILRGMGRRYRRRIFWSSRSLPIGSSGYHHNHGCHRGIPR